MYEVALNRKVAPWVINRTTTVVIGVAALGTLTLAMASRQAFPVVAPLVAIVVLAASVVVHLYYSDGHLPVFDLGALTILITAAYSAIPLLGFWLAGLRWTELSYLPLYLLNPGPAEVGGFAWRHVLYLYSFTAAYLFFRGRVAIACGPTRELRPTAIVAMAILGAGLLGYFKLLEVIFGVSYDPSYNDLAAVVASADTLPLVVRQLSHNLFAILFLLKLGALVWLMSRWRDRRWRAVLFLWLALEGLSTVIKLGGRTWYVMLLLATALLYHRLVKPLAVIRAAALVGALLGGALVYGVARDLGGGLNTVAQSGVSPWATMNEFQAFYGMAYDLHARQMAGTLGPIPWQIYANDIVMLIPSQILPFGKADPCMGYVQVDGMGLGCVLGVISNAVIGLDWVELLVRGLGLGVLFAAIHRWYARRQDGYWATMFYLCMCLWCYYTYRGSTLYFGYYILYRFIPLVVAVRLVQIALRNLPRLAVVPRG
jgi:hypothetical protein